MNDEKKRPSFFHPVTPPIQPPSAGLSLSCRGNQSRQQTEALASQAPQFILIFIATQKMNMIQQKEVSANGGSSGIPPNTSLCYIYKTNCLYNHLYIILQQQKIHVNQNRNGWRCPRLLLSHLDCSSWTCDHFCCTLPLSHVYHRVEQ